MITKKPTMLERCGVTCNDDAALWDDLVRQLLGPKLIGYDPEQRRNQALQLAAAALKAAEEQRQN
ncbi:hypothetical protein ACFPU0_03555 [Pseudomonas sp. GCM10022186]|uniref:hypothetical protein n=1 Tax=Pseudomonas sp. GCM10022186 TaxID=3252650 RepID=UPI00360A29BA